VPTIGDLTSMPAAVLASARESSTAGRPSAGVRRPGSNAACGAIIGAIMVGWATCMAPRPVGLLEMRSFMPLSDDISMESTVDSSSMSMSFLT
jgi:hypothetical protein